ncbi:GntR family transcriptional regulator [Actinoallomurus sp. NPDC052308]|uniref:GntR family transcriptional regulator n=1 Tax=Actinoallomurus sp. NPDC052308 TaxID=3155530 RepID=UPI00342AF15C
MMKFAIANSLAPFGGAPLGDRVGCMSGSMRPLTTGPSLADQAYGALRQSITDGTFVPGQRLTERGLATQFQVSPTPIREAISRLEHERLLVREGRTLTVAAPTIAQLRELVHIEAALRGVAARLAATRASARQLGQIAETHAAAQRVTRDGRPVEEVAREILTLTRRFHSQIDEASGNPMLVDMIATATAFDWTARLHAATTLGTDYPAHEGHQDHQEILEALRSRDPDRAEELTRTHALHAGERFLTLAERERTAVPADDRGR